MPGLPAPWLLLAALLLAGCAAPEPAPQAAYEPQPTPGAAPADRSGFRLPALLPAPGASVATGQEPSILADRDGEFVWVATSTEGKWSDDNGTTWRALPPFKLPGAFIDGWALAQDHDGRLYAAALQGSETTVARSDDGKTWAATTRAVALSGITDRPWMAAAGRGTSAQVVLFYYDYPVGEYCARSTDAGTTWLDRNPLAGPAQGGRAFFDASGRFYFVSDDATIYRFTNGCGVGAGQAIRLIDDAGVNNMVQGTADGDDLYVAAATAGSRQVTLAGQRPDGTRARLVVSPPELQSNTFVTVAVRGDLAAVAWYGSTGSGDPSASSFTGDWNVYLSLVRDFWGTPVVSTVQLTQAPNHRGTICMGGIGCTSGRELLDYFMVDLDIWGGAHVAFVDDFTGNGGTYYLHVPPDVAPGPALLEDEPPQARFVSFVEGLTVTVDGTLSKAAPGANLTTYSWDWGDGTTGTGASTTHSYGRSGSYTIALTVADDTGLEGTFTRTVTVQGTSAATATKSTTSSASPGVPIAGGPPATTGTETHREPKGTPVPLALAAIAVLAAATARRRTR